jgi:PEP-CTERM motif-containing protein
MRPRTVAFQLACLAVLSLFQHSAAGGQLSQTQSTSSSLVATDWRPGTSGITDPLTFAQFNPSLGTLTAIDITLKTTIKNDYSLTFVNTSIPTTIYVATSATSDPSVLADPAKVALLTDGPTVTVYGPNGSSTQIFGAPRTTLPVDVVQMTEKSGTFSSMPTPTEQSYSRTLDPANAASLFSDFIGKGTVDLPVTATAFSSFYSSSGNGSGIVTTDANATVTIQYQFSSVVPEPSSAILLGLGIGIGILATRLRRRGTSRRE